MSEPFDMSLEERLEFVALSNTQVAEGLARLIKGVLDIKNPEGDITAYKGQPSTLPGNNLLLEDNTTIALE